jgi:DNA-nicking Smr family endonuclease
LHVSEAQDRCYALLILASVKGWKSLRIITGKGIHSTTTGEPKIKPKIEQLLRSSSGSIVQSFSEGNGFFHVKVKSSKSQSSGYKT